MMLQTDSLLDPDVILKPLGEAVADENWSCLHYIASLSFPPADS